LLWELDLTKFALNKIKKSKNKRQCIDQTIFTYHICGWKKLSVQHNNLHLVSIPDLVIQKSFIYNIYNNKKKNNQVQKLQCLRKNLKNMHSVFRWKREKWEKEKRDQHWKEIGPSHQSMTTLILEDFKVKGQRWMRPWLRLVWWRICKPIRHSVTTAHNALSLKLHSQLDSKRQGVSPSIV